MILSKCWSPNSKASWSSNSSVNFVINNFSSLTTTHQPSNCFGGQSWPSLLIRRSLPSKGCGWLIETGPIRPSEKRSVPSENCCAIFQKGTSPSLILKEVWGYEPDDDIETIRVHVRHLRTKLEPDPRKPRFIKTVYGAGYCLELPIPSQINELKALIDESLTARESLNQAEERASA